MRRDRQIISYEQQIPTYRAQSCLSLALAQQSRCLSRRGLQPRAEEDEQCNVPLMQTVCKLGVTL